MRALRYLRQFLSADRAPVPQNEQSRRPEVLGTLREPLLARELIVSYFSDTAAPSRELVTSSAMGFSGEARGEPGDRGAA